MSKTTTLELPDEVYGRLKRRAAENGRSPAAEAREIVVNSLSPSPLAGVPDRRAKALAAIEALQDDVDAWFGDRKPAGMVDDLIAERRAESTRHR
jgi:plasmid stability protein